jgi:hypothetical protein
VQPPAPTSVDAIELLMEGVTPGSFPHVASSAHVVDGATIRATLGIVDGPFAVPGWYATSHPIGQLPPGDYVAEHWVQCMSGQGEPYGDPYLVATATFSVVGGTIAAVAIPTLSTWGRPPAPPAGADRVVVAPLLASPLSSTRLRRSRGRSRRRRG